MWRKIKNYNMLTGQSNMFTKGTGRWIGLFFLIVLLTLFLNSGSDDITFGFHSIFLWFVLGSMISMVLQNFWCYGGSPNLIRRLPLTYKQEIFHMIMTEIMVWVLFLSLLILISAAGVGINLLFGELTVDKIMEEVSGFFQASHWHVLYEVSLTLFFFGTFYPLSFTNNKRIFWTTTCCFIGAIIAYNIAASLLLNGGSFHFDHLLDQFQNPDGWWVSLLSFGISVLYTIGGITAALKIHRPRTY